MRKKAVIYARFSSDNQREDYSRGWQVNDERYADDSGINFRTYSWEQYGKSTCCSP